MNNFGLVSRTAAAVALALASWCVQAQDAAASAPPKEGARAEVVAPLKEADALRQQGHYDEALAKIHQAESVGNLSPYESFFIARMKAAIGLASKNDPVAIQALNDALAANRFTPDEQRSALLALTQLYYQDKDYAHTEDAAHRYGQAGGTDPAAQTMLTNAEYLSGNYAAAVPELKKAVQAQIAAGQAPSDQTLRMLASAQNKVHDDAGYEQTVALLAQYHPKPDYWADLISGVQSLPGFPDRLRLDVYRLRRATGTMNRGEEYADMAQSALQAGLPEEAEKVLDEGYGRGLLGSGAQGKAQNALRAQVRKTAATDVAALQHGTPPKGSEAMVNFGLAQATAGQPQKGAGTITEALGKGGLRYPQEAKLHLGLAQWMAGQKDAALQTFKSVQGDKYAAGLAQLWAIYLQSPAANGGAQNAAQASGTAAGTGR